MRNTQTELKGTQEPRRSKSREATPAVMRAVGGGTSLWRRRWQTAVMLPGTAQHGSPGLGVVSNAVI